MFLTKKEHRHFYGHLPTILRVFSYYEGREI